MLYVGIYAWIDYQRLLVEFDHDADQAEEAFKIEQNSTERRMLQLAIYVANDPEVQQLFLWGKRAVDSEGGGAGGKLAAQARKSLFEHVRHSRDVLDKQLGFKQLQFHLAPGSLSFLRVHQPEKFGDRMDRAHYTVVAANTELKTFTGFETGRVVSGICGVTPVFAIDGETKEKVHIGALEAGTPLSTMLSIFHENLPWLNAVVVLRREYLQANLCSEFLDKLLKEKHSINGFCVEGTSSPQIEKFLARNDLSKNLAVPGRYLLRDGETHYNLISFPLRDFHGEVDPNLPDVGLIIVWQDVSSKIAAYYNNVRTYLIIPGILLFVTIEILLFYGIRLITKKLQFELEHIRKLEAVSGKAAQVVSDIDESINQPQLQLHRALQDQVNDAVKAVDAGFGLFISAAKKNGEYRVLAVSEMIWSTTAGVELYDRARKSMQQEGYFLLELKNNQMTKVLQSAQSLILNNENCRRLVGSVLPQGHPEIHNLLLVPMTTGRHESGLPGLLVLANRKNGFGADEQIIAKAYAAAAALIMHADRREVARLAAEESSRLKTEFLSNMSHELRTPMNAIMGFGQLLSDSNLDSQQQDYIDKINLSSKDLLNLIDEILMIAELDAQATVELLSEDFNLAQLVNRIAGNFAGKAKDQEVNLKVDFSAGLPSRVNGYPVQLERILNQLMGNAIKFGHGGMVTLSLALLDRSDDTATLEFAVTDQGIGISEEQQQLIFQSFRQGDGSRNRKYGGTGLGLTIAQKICRQLNCDIVVESAIGQGSHFSFQLKVKTFTAASDGSAVAAVDQTTAVVNLENAAVQSLAALVQIGRLLQQLDEPLAKLKPKPCQEIAMVLNSKQWPDNLHDDIEKLISLIGQYRFVEAQKVVACLKESL
jgi:signal transduction histidine kinase